MKTIKYNINNTIIINKSKFITDLIKINSEDDVKKELNKIKDTYKDANHYCYAYIVGNIKRFNDDGEPNGTAGRPILNILESNELNNTLCIVTRYFGGIKLGTGGLLRAYSKSVSDAISKTEITNLINGFKVTIEFSYNDIKKIDFLLKNYEIIDKNFDKNIKYTFLINESDFNLLESSFNIIDKENILITS